MTPPHPDRDELAQSREVAVHQVIAEHPDKAEQIRERPSQIGWLVGKVMQKGNFGTYVTVEHAVRNALVAPATKPTRTR